jgi:hypothetical protein
MPTMSGEDWDEVLRRLAREAAEPISPLAIDPGVDVSPPKMWGKELTVEDLQKLQNEIGLGRTPGTHLADAIRYLNSVKPTDGPPLMRMSHEMNQFNNPDKKLAQQIERAKKGFIEARNRHLGVEPSRVFENEFKLRESGDVVNRPWTVAPAEKDVSSMVELPIIYMVKYSTVRLKYVDEYISACLVPSKDMTAEEMWKCFAVVEGLVAGDTFAFLVDNDLLKHFHYFEVKTVKSSITGHILGKFPVPTHSLTDDSKLEEANDAGE